MKIGLSIIIVNYNGAKFLTNCIDSYSEFLVKNHIEYEFLIFDNASTDDSIEKLKKIASKNLSVNYFLSDVNYGFAKANNILIKKACYSTVALLNNDTFTIDIQDLCDQINGINLKADTVYTCEILNKDHTHQKNIFTYPSIFKLIVDIFLIKKPLFKIYNLLFKNEVDNSKKYFSGCYLIINKDLFEKVGGFDDSFFFYHEECDLFLRLEKYGINKEILADKIIHYGSGGAQVSDFSFKNYYVNLAKLLIKHKYGSEKHIKTLFSLAFKFRITLLRLKFTIPYSPFSHTYFNNKSDNISKDHLIELHKETLLQINAINN